jgi:hypothetical protein
LRDAESPRMSRVESPQPTLSGHPPVLLDDLVGAGKDRWRHREAERLGRLEIDDQLEGGRLLDRQVSRFGAVAALKKTRRTAW